MKDADLDGFGGLQAEREEAAEHQGTDGEGGFQVRTAFHVGSSLAVHAQHWGRT
ncbi:hypothetical protein D3C84_1089510 [compost metagenome]